MLKRYMILSFILGVVVGWVLFPPTFWFLLEYVFHDFPKYP